MPYRTVLSEQGDVLEFTTTNAPAGRSPSVRKVDADHYVNCSTGEICVYSHRSTSRAESIQSTRRSLTYLRALVNTNCRKDNIECLKWVTLTYAENVRDSARVYRDFKSFIAKYRRVYGPVEYIVVVEPQARGAWHCHVIIIHPCKAPYVPNARLRELWGQGFVQVKNLSCVDNIGAYLSAYLGDVEVDPSYQGDDAVVKTMADGLKKKFIKGGRLALYPPGMNIYRCSRGVLRPTSRVVTEEEKEALTDGLQCTFSRCRDLQIGEDFQIKVAKEYFNRNRLAVKSLDSIGDSSNPPDDLEVAYRDFHDWLESRVRDSVPV